MLRKISAYHQDAESHWVADLVCGHSQHVRHDPPWQNRPWVLSEATRNAHLGTELNCVLCDVQPHATTTAASQTNELPNDHLSAYDDARIQGLCHDGANEYIKTRSDKQRD